MKIFARANTLHTHTRTHRNKKRKKDQRIPFSGFAIFSIEQFNLTILWTVIIPMPINSMVISLCISFAFRICVCMRLSQREKKTVKHTMHACMYLCANCRTVTTVGKEIGEKNSNDALINCIDVTVTTVTQTTMTHPISKIDVCVFVCIHRKWATIQWLWPKTKVNEMKRKQRIQVITIWIGSNWNYKIL